MKNKCKRVQEQNNKMNKIINKIKIINKHKIVAC